MEMDQMDPQQQPPQAPSPDEAKEKVLAALEELSQLLGDDPQLAEQVEALKLALSEKAEVEPQGRGQVPAEAGAAKVKPVV